MLLSDSALLMPIFFDRPYRITGANVTVITYNGDAVYGFCLYTNKGHAPHRLIRVSPSVTTNAAATFTAAVDWYVDPGVYWFGLYYISGNTSNETESQYYPTRAWQGTNFAHNLTGSGTPPDPWTGVGLATGPLIYVTGERA